MMNSNNRSARRLSYLDSARRKLRRELNLMGYPGRRRTKTIDSRFDDGQADWLTAWSEARSSQKDPSELTRRVSPIR